MRKRWQFGSSVSAVLVWVRRKLWEWRPYVEPAVPADDLLGEMLSACVPSVGFFFMLGLASVIATFGLIADSAPAIIGAMIIAPLMSPIMSLSFGLVVFERRLIVMSLVTLAVGAVWTVGRAGVPISNRRASSWGSYFRKSNSKAFLAPSQPVIRG